MCVCAFWHGLTHRHQYSFAHFKCKGGENEHGRIFTHLCTSATLANLFITVWWQVKQRQEEELQALSAMRREEQRSMGLQYPPDMPWHDSSNTKTSKQHSFARCLQMFCIALYCYVAFLLVKVLRARYAKSASRRVESERARREEICSNLAASCIHGKLSILYCRSLTTQFWMHSSTIKAKCHALGSFCPHPVQCLDSLLEQHARLIEQNPCYELSNRFSRSEIWEDKQKHEEYKSNTWSTDKVRLAKNLSLVEGPHKRLNPLNCWPVTTRICTQRCRKACWGDSWRSAWRYTMNLK